MKETISEASTLRRRDGWLIGERRREMQLTLPLGLTLCPATTPTTPWMGVFTQRYITKLTPWQEYIHTHMVSFYLQTPFTHSLKGWKTVTWLMKHHNSVVLHDINSSSIIWWLVSWHHFFWDKSFSQTYWMHVTESLVPKDIDSGFLFYPE